jgi:Family of unknown function (DUF6011)
MTTDIETTDETAIDADQPSTDSPLQITVDQLNLSKHDAVLTLVSPKSGDHRTIRVRTVRHGNLEGKRVVELLTGPCNTDDFQAFGFISDGTGLLPAGTVIVWKKYRGDWPEKSQHERLADLLNRPIYWSGRGVEFLISLKCRRCHRDLTHPSSLADGLGPYCRRKVMG